MLVLNVDGTGLSLGADRSGREGDVVAVFHVLSAAAGWGIASAVMDLTGGVEGSFVFSIDWGPSGCEPG